MFLLVFIIGFGAAVILSLNNSPPALQLNILQAFLLNGEYMPLVSALILAFPLLIGIAIVKSICILLFNLFFVKQGEPKIPLAYKIRWK